MKPPSLYLLISIFFATLATAQDPQICKPQKENEVRVSSHNFGSGPVLITGTPKLKETLIYNRDGKTLLTRMLECVLIDSDQERVTQEISIDYGIVTSCRIEKIDKANNRISNSIYSPSGTLLYTYHQNASQKGQEFYDVDGKSIDEARARQIYEAHRSEQIDIAKIMPSQH